LTERGSRSRASAASDPRALLRCAAGTVAAASLLFGLTFHSVPAMLFVAAGATALGAGGGTFATRRALRSGLAPDATPPALEPVGVLLVALGLTFLTLGLLRYVTMAADLP
jgi:hypothetical protein